IVGQALRSIMATPLRARGRVIGVVYVDSKVFSGLFRDDDLDGLDALSAQAAVAIDNARLFNATDQALGKRVDQLQELRRIDLLLNATLDTDQAMMYTLEWACRLTDATSGHLALVEDDLPRLHSVQHYGTHSAINGEYPALEELHPELREVVQSGKTMPLTAPGNGVLVPIRRETETIGVLILERATPAPFTPDQQDLVERLAARAAIAIDNARLVAAVRAADRAKSEFVGIVAHDLKAPMNSIGGYAELLLMQKDATLSDKQQDYLRKVRDTVRRMEMLVSDLADISRIESGLFFMEVSRVLAEDIVQAVKDNTLPQMIERKHTLQEIIAPNLPMMQVDYFRLLQVLTNLISNAYKYTPDGGTITLEVTRGERAVRFSVSDTGIGMSEDDLKKLGTKFWRAEDRYTRAQPGTGLGFAITKALVEQMGSTLAVKSVVGKGSSFAFDIAVAE
ncbi:MAG: GAF domain-containing protein, partial [Armatimonadetes bacterium]|nr:GAF domain-containing protein [Anaerolineae bacterium]